MENNNNKKKLSKLNRRRREGHNLLLFINSPVIVPEIIRKHDIIKLKIDECFMIHNTIDPSLDNKIGIVVSEPMDKETNISISILDTNQLIRDVPKFFCCLEKKVFMSRVSDK